MRSIEVLALTMPKRVMIVMSLADSRTFDFEIQYTFVE